RRMSLWIPDRPLCGPPRMTRFGGALRRLVRRRLAGFELVQRAHPRFCGFRRARLFHVSVAADGLVGADHADGGRMGRWRETLGEIGDVGFEFGNEALFELALIAETERVEPGASQGLEPGHEPE